MVITFAMYTHWTESSGMYMNDVHHDNNITVVIYIIDTSWVVYSYKVITIMLYTCSLIYDQCYNIDRCYNVIYTCSSLTMLFIHESCHRHDVYSTIYYSSVLYYTRLLYHGIYYIVYDNDVV